MTRIEIRRSEDIGTGFKTVVNLARVLDFGKMKETMLATAVVEITRNIVEHSYGGYVEIMEVNKEGNIGIRIVAKDTGPGIEDINLALSDHFSTKNTLGIGLPGAMRLMDDFEINSDPQSGTTVIMTKWK